MIEVKQAASARAFHSAVANERLAVGERIMLLALSSRTGAGLLGAPHRRRVGEQIAMLVYLMPTSA
jgi:hypothetical protein